MASDTLARIATAQADLLAALDTRDAAAIEAATRNLSEAIQAVKTGRSDFGSAAALESVGNALRQNEAARLRIGFLSCAVSDRLARLSEIREPSRRFSYARPRIS